LKVPPNITLIELPPYSPELNPVENLWHYLRSHYWSNRTYPNYDSLMQAAAHAWRQSCLNPETIKTVCAAPYLQSANK
jgi:transposase